MSKLFEDSGKRLSKVIDYEDIKFDFIDQIGSGGFGKVYAGFLNGRKIGIKKITIYDNDPNKNILLKFLEREIYTLKMLSHPNVIQFYGIAEKERSLFLLTELVSGGDLHWYIKNKDIKMPWMLKFKIARDIAASMYYLHSNGVIHRDLKSTNLLVAENWVIKVCDMGLARKMDKSEKSKMTICGTDDWMAPEVLIGEEYDSACDVFSFGMVLIELITRENLSPRIRNEELGIDNVYFYSRIPDSCPTELVRLVNECCKVSPADRPNFFNIYGVLTYLLENYDLGDDYEPPLRTFKPPELHIPIINNQNNNSNDSGFSFPRPFQPSNINNDQNNDQNNNQLLESDFSFPRPYQPSNIKDNNNQNALLESDFSFPRPFQPSNINDNNSNNQPQDSHYSFPRPFQPDDAQKEDGDEEYVEEEEMKQLKRQLFSRFNSQDSFPRPYQESKIVTFEESELLSFPRPYQSQDSNGNKQPLLETPNFSFPRPYNPDTESSFKDSSIDQFKSKIIIPSSENSSNNDNSKPTTTTTTTTKAISDSTSQPTSRISISTATVQNKTPNSVFRSTATVQNKSRSMSTPVKPSNSVTSNSSNSSTLNNSNNAFSKSKAPTSNSTNKVVIGNVRENSNKSLLLNQTSQNNYSNRVITINKSNNSLANTLNTSNSNNSLNKSGNNIVNNSSNNLVSNSSNNIVSNSSNNNLNNLNSTNNTVKRTINNNHFTSSNNVIKNNTVSTVNKNKNDVNNNNNNVKVVTNNNNNKKEDINSTNNKLEENDNNKNNEENDEESANGDKVVHRRSRSLDIKSSTKGLIKKFEELTRFNSQQSNINNGISKIEGKLHFGSETLSFEKVSPINGVNSNNNNSINNNNNNQQVPLSPKKGGFWKPKK